MINFLLLCALASTALVWSVKPPRGVKLKSKKSKASKEKTDARKNFIGSRFSWTYTILAFLLLAGATAIGWWSLGIAAAGGVLFIPSLRLAGRSKRESRLIAAGMFAWVEQVKALVVAGMSLNEALSESSHNVTSIVPMRMFAAEAESQGTTQALLSLSRNLADPMADMAIVALMMAEKEGGGRLGEVLNDVCDHIKENLRLEEEADAARSGIRNTRRVTLVSGVLLSLGMIFLVGASYYKDIIGQIVLLIGFMAIGGIMWWMTRLERFPTPSQFILRGQE